MGSVARVKKEPRDPHRSKSARCCFWTSGASAGADAAIDAKPPSRNRRWNHRFKAGGGSRRVLGVWTYKFWVWTSLVVNQDGYVLLLWAIHSRQNLGGCLTQSGRLRPLDRYTSHFRSARPPTPKKAEAFQKAGSPCLVGVGTPPQNESLACSPCLPVAT